MCWKSLLGLLVVTSSLNRPQTADPLALWARKIDPVARRHWRLHKHGGIRGQGSAQALAKQARQPCRCLCLFSQWHRLSVHIGKATPARRPGSACGCHLLLTTGRAADLLANLFIFVAHNCLLCLSLEDIGVSLVGDGTFSNWVLFGPRSM